MANFLKKAKPSTNIEEEYSNSGRESSDQIESRPNEEDYENHVASRVQDYLANPRKAAYDEPAMLKREFEELNNAISFLKTK
jgi:hypothetical protein